MARQGGSQPHEDSVGAELLGGILFQKEIPWTDISNQSLCSSFWKLPEVLPEVLTVLLHLLALSWAHMHLHLPSPLGSRPEPYSQPFFLFTERKGTLEIFLGFGIHGVVFFFPLFAFSGMWSSSWAPWAPREPWPLSSSGALSSEAAPFCSSDSLCCSCSVLSWSLGGSSPPSSQVRHSAVHFCHALLQYRDSEVLLYSTVRVTRDECTVHNSKCANHGRPLVLTGNS